MEEKQLEFARTLAKEVLIDSRNTLLINMRFLDAALNQLELKPIDESSLLTDGKYLLYNPRRVLTGFKRQWQSVTRDYLHAVMHCVCRHLFVSPTIDRTIWDLACDIAVEDIISDLGVHAVESDRQHYQRADLDRLRRECGKLTAEKIYTHLKAEGCTAEQAAMMRAQFYADNHEIWYMTEDQKYKRFGIGQKTRYTLLVSGDGKSYKQSSVTSDDPMAGTGAEQVDMSTALTADDLDKIWRKIGERAKISAETFNKLPGMHGGLLMQTLAEVTREKYDYTEFLKKFAVMGEVMKINDEEFDYVFYSYGMQLYKNVPLIEPLEYQDTKRIKEFVIAIDSSMSITQAQAQEFLQKTYNILKSSGSFFSKVNIHIIQCDAVIQEHVKITNQEELDHYISIYRRRGGGGTDFRPVFAAIDEMVENGEFTNLKGMIYFTDAYGPFPDEKPAYDAAIAFVEDDMDDIPEIPSWAIKTVFKKSDLWGDVK